MKNFLMEIKKFELHLKYLEWRYGKDYDTLEQELLKIVNGILKKNLNNYKVIASSDFNLYL